MALLALFVVPGAALACPDPPYPSTEVCLRWSAPTQYTNGSPITTPLTYRIYVDGVAVAETSALYYRVTNLRSGTRSFNVTALTNGQESAPSGTGYKTIRPAAPTDGTIEAPTDGSFEP